MGRLIKVFIVLFLIFNILFFGFVFYPVPRVLQAMRPTETFKIFDRNGILLFESLDEASGRSTTLGLEQIPESLKTAFLSIEDKRFYEHSGVDFRAILRAVWQNISTGEIVSGGSTITQQLVRNLVGINQKRTVSQKVKESLFALKISRFFSKDQLFEAYLNTIYFGGLAYGVEAASWQYFNKSAVNLDLAESALLAGLPQAPNRLNPFKHFDAAVKRQKEVLSAMLENNVITQDAYDGALEETLTLSYGSPSKKAPHFVDMVLSDLGYGQSLTGSLSTTLDYGLQERTETILQSDLSFLSHRGIGNAATVIIDIHTGGVLAMVGSADFSSRSIQGEVNVATSLRQPGSSIKPLVYAAAFEKGWTPETVIVDEPVQYSTPEGLPYSPKNFDLTYHGPVTTAQALSRSLNVPAVKTMDFVGVSSFLRLARLFGITTFTESPEHYGLSLALGSAEVTLVELTHATSVFARGGQQIPLVYAVGKMPEPVRVVSAQTAAFLSAILSNNELRLPEFGEENPLHFSFTVAAKTGTTRNFRDNWTIGFTDDYAVGVWAGNTRGEAMEGVSGISGAAPIFYKLMNMLHEETGTVLTAGQDVPLSVKNLSSDYEPSKDTFRILSPFSNDLYQFDPSKPAGYQKIKLEASHSSDWFVDEQKIGTGSSILWQITRGEHFIKAVADGEEKVVRIEVR